MRKKYTLNYRKEALTKVNELMKADKSFTQAVHEICKQESLPKSTLYTWFKKGPAKRTHSAQETKREVTPFIRKDKDDMVQVPRSFLKYLLNQAQINL